jgi:hypothetical protein
MTNRFGGMSLHTYVQSARNMFPGVEWNGKAENWAEQTSQVVLEGIPAHS